LLEFTRLSFVVGGKRGQVLLGVEFFLDTDCLHGLLITFVVVVFFLLELTRLLCLVGGSWQVDKAMLETKQKVLKKITGLERECLDLDFSRSVRTDGRGVEKAEEETKQKELEENPGQEG
jgi:hypothetical protein